MIRDIMRESSSIGRQEDTTNMPIFPDRKADKDALYAAVVAGITANSALFPSGAGQPFALATLNARITAKNTAVNTRQQEEGQFRTAVTVESGTYGDCDDETRRLLNLAIATHGVDSPHLVLLGWGPRAAATSQVPGQPRTLEAMIQGPGWVFLDWKAPAPGGGAVAFYRIERRVRSIPGVPQEDWGVVSFPLDRFVGKSGRIGAGERRAWIGASAQDAEPQIRPPSLQVKVTPESER